MTTCWARSPRKIERDRPREGETAQASAVTIKEKFFREHIRREPFNGRGSYAPHHRRRRRRRRRRHRRRRRRAPN
ncbi:hypothetical protein PUN28_016428 [Cardiocondyla obscurior]|uniref:Uncharacterized protein n=1 Tax=Cardiocondyla obscurior TaxID=286306 RepID=A0AAW2EPC9_9HYME